MESSIRCNSTCSSLVTNRVLRMYVGGNTSEVMVDCGDLVEAINQRDQAVVIQVGNREKMRCSSAEEAYPKLKNKDAKSQCDMFIVLFVILRRKDGPS